MILRLAVLLLIATPALAEPPKWAAAVLADGFAAQHRGDYRQASADFRRLAGQGSAIAETMLGTMAARGQGSAVDHATAATWWLRAARRGYAPAQFALAQAYAEGRGVGLDPRTAWVWARLAATHGDTVTAVAAGELVTRLQRGFDTETLKQVERRQQAWRPWATLSD